MATSTSLTLLPLALSLVLFGAGCGTSAEDGELTRSDAGIQCRVVPEDEDNDDPPGQDVGGFDGTECIGVSGDIGSFLDGVDTFQVTLPGPQQVYFGLTWEDSGANMELDFESADTCPEDNDQVLCARNFDGTFWVSVDSTDGDSAYVLQIQLPQ